MDGVEVNPYYLTATLTPAQKQFPVVQRVVQYLQRITGLLVANVVLNVYSGDDGREPARPTCRAIMTTTPHCRRAS